MKNILQLIIVALLSTGSPVFAQAPVLGSASTFVLFTTAGAITNTGISHITGNVGASTGAITGFGNVNGVMHPGDVAAATGAADVLTAYGQLDAAIAGYFIGPAIGNDDTLIAGVYSISGNATLSDTLILDGQANPDAVFIIKIQGAFASATAAKVILINGAKACNVFWKTEGMVSLANETSMKGTLIAHNAAIDIGSGVTWEGRALSTTGAITLNSVLAYLPAGCGSPVLTGPAPPDMRSAACYVLFTGNGAATNSGITYATGDIGTNVGLTTGFQALNVTGTIHPIPDASTASAIADLLDAHTYLDLLPYDIELLYPAQFGNDLVLTPHIYLLNAATALTGNLILNAEGNPNAVFVLKIYGALSTSTYAKVLLINGAQAKNVFWKVEGAVSINDYSEFKGTIISNNGALNLNTGVLLEGRALTTNGALSTAAITATMTPGCGVPLDLSWLHFTGKYTNASVVLHWRLAAVTPAASFIVERSKEGKKFEALATIKALSGNESTALNYSFIDLYPEDLSYYRIVHTDWNGIQSFSAVLKINGGQSEMSMAAQVYPNPHTHSLSVTLNPGTPTHNNTIEIYNLLGSVVLSADLREKTTSLVPDLPSGIYIYKIIHQEHTLQSGQIISKR